MRQVIMQPKAYEDMRKLIEVHDLEVGWMGVVERLNNDFLLKEILVYPQKQSAAHIETDPEQMYYWYQLIPDDKLKELRFSGHSHVKMKPTPSFTDINDERNTIEEMVRTAKENRFYIFLIINKRLEYTPRIYDAEAAPGEKFTSSESKTAELVVEGDLYNR